MAQSDLFKLLQDFRAELSEKKSGERFRAKVTDVWEHRVVVEREEIKKELRIQLAEFSRTGRKTGELGLSKEATAAATTQEAQEAFLAGQGSQFDEKKVNEIVDFYINALHEGFTRDVPRGYKAQVTKKSSGLEVIFTADPNASPGKKDFLESLGKQGPVFSNLGKVFSGARLALNRQIAQKFKLKIDANKETTFQVGHVTAVAQLRAGAVLSTIQKQDVTALLGTLQFTGLSELVRNQGELIKKFDMGVAYVKPQSAVANNLASKHDATILKQVRDAVEAALTEMLDRDWASQAGSNSLVDAVMAELIEVATKRKATIKGNKPKKDFSKSKAKGTGLPIEAKFSRFETKATLGNVTEGLQVSGNPTVSLRSLIPMLNQRLPEIVRSHMGQAGRLVNRTGRFAESTEIIDIGDNMVISYTYQRDPYDVFERNAARDPRPLIDMSIRELAAGLIRQRFTTRRV